MVASGEDQLLGEAATPTRGSLESAMSDKTRPSTFAAALVGIGTAAAMYGVMRLVLGEETTFGAFSAAAGELKNAIAAHDAAFRRLWAAENKLEAIKAEAWDEDEDQWVVGLLPRLREAQAEIRAARAEADAAKKRMREWSEVVRLERKPATTEVGREADRLLNELEDLFQPRRGN